VSILNTAKVKASTKYQHISAYKVRRVANLIRGKSALFSIDILRSIPHKGARVIDKVLKSAIANAQHNFNLNPNSLIVSEILINEGPQSKRFQPRARGRIFKIIKRTAHINITLGGSPVNGGR